MEIIRNHYSVKDMKKFSFEVLKKGGYSDEAAQATSYALLEADIRGIYSHGIAGGTGLEEAVKRTGITATVDLEVEPVILEKKYPTIAVIDGNGAPGLDCPAPGYPSHPGSSATAGRRERGEQDCPVALRGIAEQPD